MSHNEEFIYENFKMHMPKGRKEELINIIELSDAVSIEKKHYTLDDSPGKTKACYRFTVTKSGGEFKFDIYADDLSHYHQSILIEEARDDVFKFYQLELQHILDFIYISSNNELKRKIEVIRCKNEKCPICDSKVDIDDRAFNGNNASLRCSNGCYVVRGVMESLNSFYFNVIIFKDESSYYKSNVALEEKIKRVNAIYDKIEYWKENDKYLIKILKEDD
ncbi:gp455 [Bacillus phage G]|uniref:Gp455 n=1 Tax=Bacillus phage G TaxID=2884420 RepID=G3MAJ6_9CAUD|nr:gp455 [Bacillus phage G]AEO93713.1 gp455 [Bacillus phage G]